MGRPPCCDKSNVKRGLWTAEEDAKILAYVATHGVGNWTLVPKKAGLNRCGKSCRLRWTNYLRPDLKHDSFTPKEEELIINLHKVVGSRWSLIARELPGRTDNDVKNYWNTKLRKKLQKMGIDPVTHKPFSQIFTDYRNISGLLVTANQIGSFNRNLNPVVGQNLESASLLIEEHQNPVMLVNHISGQLQVNNSLLNNNNNNNNNDNNNPLANASPSWDTTLLAQFSQLELEKMQPSFYYNEVTSSTSSSTTVAQSQDQTTASSPFGWSDFLVGEPFLPAEFQHEEEIDHLDALLMSSTSPQGSKQDGNSTCKFPSGGASEFGLSRIGDRVNFQCKAASSSANSFVEAILDSDDKMRTEFTELLDGSFEY